VSAERGLTPEQIAAFTELIQRKLHHLAVRAKDPQHPMHSMPEWNPRTGKAIMPTDADQIGVILMAALKEPEPN
jgi:hypothetical protein